LQKEKGTVKYGNGHSDKFTELHLYISKCIKRKCDKVELYWVQDKAIKAMHPLIVL
jgi:hypothetical protein